MAAPESIGVPLSINIWHDNTGGDKAGWYLNKVVLVDVKTQTWQV